MMVSFKWRFVAMFREFVLPDDLTFRNSMEKKYK